MKRIFLILVALTMICDKVKTPFGQGGSFRRCENDEVVCYAYDWGNGSGVSCKWKESK